MKKLTLSMLVTALCTLTLCAAAQAQIKVTFVSMTGNDANDCLSAATACRSFQRGVDAVPAGGTVVARDSGGYGPVSITKSVTLAGDGQVAGINRPSSGTAVSVSGLAPTDTVILSGLQINGLVPSGPSHIGISVISGYVKVINSRISGFGKGVAASGSGKVMLENTIVSGNTTALSADGNGGCRFNSPNPIPAVVFIHMDGGAVTRNNLAFEMLNTVQTCQNSTNGQNIAARLIGVNQFMITVNVFDNGTTVAVNSNSAPSMNNNNIETYPSDFGTRVP